MTITGYTRTIVLLAGLILFVEQSGCAFMHHQPTDSVRPIDQLGTIGVVSIQSSEETRLYLPENEEVRGTAARAMVQGFGK